MERSGLEQEEQFLCGFVFLMFAICVFPLLRVPEILSGYAEGQFFSLTEETRTCETGGPQRKREGRESRVNQRESRREIEDGW